ncbi:MAG: hypothetical protein KY459_13350 [Acidobacteria bacterium]|nr:hypothetical protein [Acidobacteriota bacterium]
MTPEVGRDSPVRAARRYDYEPRDDTTVTLRVDGRLRPLDVSHDFDQSRLQVSD